MQRWKIKGEGMKAFWAGLGISAGLGLMAIFLKDKRRERSLRRALDHGAQAADAAASRAHSLLRETVPVGASQVSLNSVSREELLKVYGIGPVLADRIIENRPYQNDYDVVERGIIPESGYRRLKAELLNRRAG